MPVSIYTVTPLNDPQSQIGNRYQTKPKSKFMLRSMLLYGKRIHKLTVPVIFLIINHSVESLFFLPFLSFIPNPFYSPDPPLPSLSPQSFTRLQNVLPNCRIGYDSKSITNTETINRPIRSDWQNLYPSKIFCTSEIEWATGKWNSTSDMHPRTFTRFACRTNEGGFIGWNGVSRDGVQRKIFRTFDDILIDMFVNLNITKALAIAFDRIEQLNGQKGKYVCQQKWLMKNFWFAANQTTY